jgi:hypothetical protein
MTKNHLHLDTSGIAHGHGAACFATAVIYGRKFLTKLTQKLVIECRIVKKWRL